VPRFLMAVWHRVAAPDRPEAMRLWRVRRNQLAADGVRHWLFVSDADPDSFLEFTEAGDPGVLRAARSRAGLLETVPILTEVELP